MRDAPDRKTQSHPWASPAARAAGDDGLTDPLSRTGLRASFRQEVAALDRSRCGMPRPSPDPIGCARRIVAHKFWDGWMPLRGIGGMERRFNRQRWTGAAEEGCDRDDALAGEWTRWRRQALLVARRVAE